MAKRRLGPETEKAVDDICAALRKFSTKIRAATRDEMLAADADDVQYMTFDLDLGLSIRNRYMWGCDPEQLMIFAKQLARALGRPDDDDSLRFGTDPDDLSWAAITYVARFVRGEVA